MHLLFGESNQAVSFSSESSATGVPKNKKPTMSTIRTHTTLQHKELKSQFLKVNVNEIPSQTPHS